LAAKASKALASLAPAGEGPQPPNTQTDLWFVGWCVNPALSVLNDHGTTQGLRRIDPRCRSPLPDVTPVVGTVFVKLLGLRPHNCLLRVDLALPSSCGAVVGLADDMQLADNVDCLQPAE